jgi:hypothetical protein
MTGGRHNAKNTLVENYLYLAERAGATVLPPWPADNTAGGSPAQDKSPPSRH